MALSENLRGAAFMAGSMTAFTVNDTVMKYLGRDFELFQLLLLRSVGVAILLALLAYGTGALKVKLSRRDWALVALRGISEVVAVFLFLIALFNMPIANLIAILQALPLTVSLGAALVLKEVIGWRRITAIVVGFLGVFLIVRPGADGFTIYSVLGVLSVLCVTVRDLTVRRISVDVPTATVTFVSAVFVLIFAAFASLTVEWQPMFTADWLWLLVAMGFVLCGYQASVLAMRRGDVGFVTQFRYTSLLAALLLGFLVFGEWPDGLTLIGASIVVATGLFTIWRERSVRE